MIALSIFYSIDVVFFAIFWYGKLLLDSWYNTNSMVEVSLLITALFLLIFPIIFIFLVAYILAGQQDDENEHSRKKARLRGFIYGVLATGVIRFKSWRSHSETGDENGSENDKI